MAQPISIATQKAQLVENLKLRLKQTYERLNNLPPQQLEDLYYSSILQDLTNYYANIRKIKEELIKGVEFSNENPSTIIMPSSTLHLMKQPRAQQINQVN